MTIEETVGSLKAHEERLKGQKDTSGSQLLLTREEWLEREKDESTLLLTREEWTKRNNKGNSEASSQKLRGRDYNRNVRDKSKVRCFKCSAYGHYAAECKKPKRDREIKEEAHMAQIPDDEPALLLVEGEEKTKVNMLINKERVMPRLNQDEKGKQIKSNMWYLDNGASNHMTGQYSKFDKIDEGIVGQVKFGDGSIV